MSNASDPVSRWTAIANDGTDIRDTIRTASGDGYSIRAIYVASVGTIELKDGEGNALYFSNLPVGIYPLRPFCSTSNTTATLYALYGH